MNLFSALEQGLPKFSKSELRIAKTILADPKLAVDSTIIELAQRAQTSQATVARFCQGLNFHGYRDFRVALASATSREQTTREIFSISDADILPTDSASDVLTKVAYLEARAIEDTAKSIDPAVLDRVVEALQSADIVEVYGAGSSGLTAQDLNQKLNRLGFRSNNWSDAHLALTSTALVTERSVVFAISHSGLTTEANEILDTANSRGATTVALTNFPNSPLAELADHLLVTTARDTRYRSGAMSSRIVQMAVIDFLIVRLLQLHREQSAEALRSTYETIQLHRGGSASNRQYGRSSKSSEPER